MKGYRDKYGVWNIEDKAPPADERFDLEVADKVARSEGVDGWSKGPVFICEQAAEEPVDSPAWLMGLDLYPKPFGVDERRARIHRKAADLWREIMELKALYE